MKKNYAKFLSGVLMFAIIFGVVPSLGVFANAGIKEYTLGYEEYYKSHNAAAAELVLENERYETVWPEQYLADGETGGSFSSFVIETILNAMKEGKSSVYVYSYNINRDLLPELFATIEEQYPIEYIASDFYYYGYSYYSSGRVDEIKFYYRNDVAERDYTQRYKSLLKVTDDIINSSDLTDAFTTTLDFHDYLVLNSQYDTTYSIYDAYTILTTGVGVCQAYADSFRLLCSLVDVPCITVSSVNMNHAWNMVEIDNEWYHIDATWDDPVPDVEGRNYYTHMYHSDTSFEENCEHYGWDSSGIVADSEAFANMPRNSGYKQFFENNLWYYISDGLIYTCDRYGNNVSVLIDGISSNTLGYYEGLIAYSNGKSIYTYDISSGETECVYTMVAEESGDLASNSSVSIYSMSVSETGLITYKCYTWKYNSDKGNYTSNIIDGVNTVQLSVPKTENVFVFKLSDTNAYYFNIDTKYTIAVPAQFVDGRTLVPLREVSSSIGITDLKYEASTGKITFTSFDGYTVEMTMESTTATLTRDGTTVTEIITAPVFVDGVAMLPLRDTANFTGGTVKYDDTGYVVVSAGEVADTATYIAGYKAAYGIA